MRVTKIISAVTALSMTVTGLAVATSANSASPDAISNALGDLSNYGIVAENMTTNSHFEANYAVKNLTLNNNYDVSKFISGKSRTITFSVTSEESFAEGPVTHLLGVYSNGERIEVEYQGKTTSGLIAVDFSEPGTKTFTVTIPEEYKYETVTVHKIVFNEYENEDGDVYKAMEFADEGVQFFPHALDAQDALAQNSKSIISDSMSVGGELFGTDKTIYVGSDIYSTLKFENDGRISGLKPRVEWVTDPETGKAVAQNVYDEEGNQVYDTTIIANNTNKFYEMPAASDEVDRLVNYIKTASDNLAAINSGSTEDKVLYYKFNGSIYSGSDEATKIREAYKFIKDNPSYSLLVNVVLEEGENSYVFNSGEIGDWDADSSSRIVFNFIGGLGADKTHITLGDGFRGVAVAPNARVSNSATFCGAVYAPEYAISSGEIHMATYRAFNDSYQAYYYDIPVETTTEETTTEETTTEETTTEETTPEETTPEETTPEETTTEETTTEETTPEETTTEETTTEETTPEETTTEETTTEVTTPEETTPEETVPEETTPEETVPEDTTPEETVPEDTTPEETVPEDTTPEETVPTVPEETTPEETVPTVPEETTPEETVPTVTEETTTEETTPEETTTEETTTEATTPEETTTEGTTPEETTTEETTPEETTEATTPEDTTPEETAPEETTTEDAETSAATTLPPEETTVATTTAPPETSATTTVPVTFPVEEDVPRDILELIEEEVPRDELILIDEEVPLGDMPMNTGVESNIGVFAVIGGAALMIGAGAQFYSVILRKKH